MLLRNGEACERLGISLSTLRILANRAIIKAVRTNGGHRRYCSHSIDEYLSSTANIVTQEEKGGGGTSGTNDGQYVAYARVSSASQKDDLQRQIEHLERNYPKFRIIHDIGSGLNFKRKGLRAILELAMQGNLKQLVVAHRDRLSRFAFDLIEWIVNRNGGRVIVTDKDEGRHSPEVELTEDLVSIITIFSCRIQGKRRYGRKRHRIEEHESENQTYQKAKRMVDQDPTQPESVEECYY